MTTSELYPILEAMLSPWEDDLKSYPGRKDTVFSQLIRNFTAPERLTEFNKKFVKSEDGKLSLTDFGQQVYNAIFSEDKKSSPEKVPAIGYPMQAIYFGAPGVGKSHKLKSVYTNDDDVVRTTFHPETDYASFVGCYKPQTKEAGDEEGNAEIIYKFQGQAFTEAYAEAWRRYLTDVPRKDFFLVIEEINRGNCAQIFGDIFQLLDRNDEGFSDYPVRPDKDLTRYLGELFKSPEYNIAGELDRIKPGLGDGSWMMLPPNLHILATMNTSDQSLFPIDSAFKRRWEWVYMPIETAPHGIDKRTIDTDDYQYDWSEFLDKVNSRIFSVTGSEDKQLGFWFVKPRNGSGTISANDFVSKVLFYLWNDIFKDFGDDSTSIFNFSADGNPDSEEKDRHSFKDFTPRFRQADSRLVDAFLLNLGMTQAKKEKKSDE